MAGVTMGVGRSGRYGGMLVGTDISTAAEATAGVATVAKCVAGVALAGANGAVTDSTGTTGGGVITAAATHSAVRDSAGTNGPTFRTDVNSPAATEGPAYGGMGREG